MVQKSSLDFLSFRFASFRAGGTTTVVGFLDFVLWLGHRVSKLFSVE